jgi:hypothetical protein
MKKYLYHNLFTKRNLIWLFVMGFCTMQSFGQWSMYTASVMPDENDPAFGTSGLAGAGMTSSLVTDPNNPDNQFLELLTLVTSDNGTWRRVYADAVTDVTIVMRVKSADDNGRRVLELDLDNGGFRERLYINQEDNKVRLQHSEGFGVDNEFPLPGEASVKDWHIYRITKDAEGNVRLYVDEDPEALAVGKTAQATSNNHFRFGDTNGSHNVSALIDWIIWDKSGTYAPGEGTPIPEELLPQEEEKNPWFVYDAGVMPTDNDPAFGSSGLAGAGLVTELVEDPGMEGNSLLQLLTLANEDNGTWRHVYPDPVADVTVVMRVKSAGDNGRRVLELDLDNGGFRERLYINQEDNKVRLQHAAGFGVNNEFPLPGDASVKGWNIYRLTKDAEGNVKLYVNEDPEPLAVGQTAQATSNNHFRFGDTNGSHNISGLVDWVIWDTSGVYAPGEGTPIPAALSLSYDGPEEPETHNWRIYDANVFPNEQIPAFITSSGSFNETENQLIDDPDQAENKLLRMDVSGNPQSQFLWRQNFATQGIELEALTVVMRVKGNESRDMIMDLDMHFNDKRSRISIHTETSLARIRNGTGDDIELTNTLTDWNIYRFTMTDTETRLYVNEGAEAVLVFEPAAAASSNRHFRFGDGDSSNSMGADIDWVVWDFTGAYAPGEGDAIPEPVVTPNWDATLSELLVDGTPVDGFDPEELSYEIIVDEDNEGIPQISAIQSNASATLVVTQTETLPGEATAVVTAANGFTVMTYTVVFRYASSDARLSDLQLAGETMAGFDPSVTEYAIELPQGTSQAPEVTATAADEHATVTIVQAQSLPGEATITVVAENGDSWIYKIMFTVDATSVAALQPLQARTYPNPVESTLTIDRQNSGIKALIRLISLHGQVLMQYQTNDKIISLELGHLNTGMYLMQLIEEGQTYEQIIIKR